MCLAQGPQRSDAGEARNIMLSLVENYKAFITLRPGPEVIKLFRCSTQLSAKFIPLINVKMPTLVGILTFISMIITTSERHFFVCWYLSFYEQLIFCAQLSMKKVL